MAHFTEKLPNKKLQRFGVFEFIILIAVLAAVYWLTTSRPFYPPANKIDRKEVPIGDFPEGSDTTKTQEKEQEQIKSKENL
jgi:hypothetical protein